MIAPYKVSLTKVSLQCETNIDDNNSGLYILNAAIHKLYIYVNLHIPKIERLTELSNHKNTKLHSV